MRLIDVLKHALRSENAMLVFRPPPDHGWWFAIGDGDFVPFRGDPVEATVEGINLAVSEAAERYEADLGDGIVYLRSEFNEYERQKSH